MMLNLLFLLPLVGALFFSIFGRSRLSGLINIVFSFLILSVSVWIFVVISRQGYAYYWNNECYLDLFSVILIVLTSFVGLMVAIFSSQYMYHNLESGRISKNKWRLYFVLFQLFIGFMLLVYAANNIGIIWVAMEGATLSTVLLVSLYRTPESIEAAWKYFILCIVGIALALFGTICVYFSAKNIALGSSAILWTVLYQNASLLDTSVLTFAFVFLLVGYGTKIGLVPMHFWLPDAHSESPAPISALLSGLLLNLGVYTLVRFKMLIDPSVTNHLAGHLMMFFGLLSFIVSVIFIYRQWNIKRMFSYSSIEHMGLIVFLFGVGSPLATFGGIFYMIVHSLVKSAIFMSVGNVLHLMKSQDMNKIRGLMDIQPMVGWMLLVGVVAIVGFPPFAVFNCEITVVLAAISQNIFIAIVLIVGMLIALAGLFKNLQPVFFNKSSEVIYPVKICRFPIIVNLSLAFLLGIYMPPVFLHALNRAVTLISGGGIL